jgi:hypothetical protein
MILNGDHTPQSTGFNPECRRVSKISGIKNIFLVKRSFSFSSFTDFEDVDVWITAIKAGNIYPMLGNKQADSASDPLKAQKNKQDFTYKTSAGKYRFVHHYNVEYDYGNILKGFSETGYDYMFQDLNGNIFGYTSDGTTVQGFETDSILFEKMDMGPGNQPNWTKIHIELTDADQLDRNAKIINPDWSVLRNLNLVPVDITNITEGSLTFRVTDSVSGNAVNSLRAADVTISDNSGTITFTTFVSKGNGYYFLDGLGSALTYGTVDVDSSIYYGSQFYTFGNAPVTISNIVFNALDDIEFDVTLNYDSSAVTGRTIPEFTITDDTHGVISIGALSESPDGHYRLSSLGNNLTTGTLAIAGDYVGSTLYDYDVDVEIYDFDTTATTIILCSVRESVSLNAVTGLTKSDFTVTDSINGVLTVNSAVEGAAGDYTLYLAGARTSGTVAVSTVNYTGSDPYDFDGPTVANGGYTAGGATDWVDTDADGKADGVLDLGATGKTFTITSNPGFTGNVQRCDFTSSVTSFAIAIDADYYESGTTYQATVKFRADEDFRLRAIGTSFDEYIDGVGDESSHIITTASFTPDATDTTIQLQFSLNPKSLGSYYLEIDEVFLIEP